MEKLINYLEKLSKEQLIDLMIASLDEMQVHSGRTTTGCVLLALGATEKEDGGWTLPKLEDVDIQQIII